MWNDLVYYDTSSPTFLRNKITRNSRALKDQPQGSLKGNPRYVTIQLNGKQNLLHRVVYELFYGQIPEGMVIDHIDGNTYNNQIENLQCISQIDNVRKGAVATLTEEQVLEIRKIYQENSRQFGARALQRKYGVTHPTILRAINGTSWFKV